MKQLRAVVFLAVLAALAVLPVARGDEAIASLIDAQAGSIVRVEFALSIRATIRGQTQENEGSGSAMGVLLDAKGMVVIPSAALEPRMRFPGRRGGRPGGDDFDVSATPTSLRVVFPGDPKEYEAVLAAKDSRLGLTFLRIKDLGDKEVAPLDLSRAGAPALGMRVFAVSRLSQGFDHAPFCAEMTLVGKVTKPREMWLLQGTMIPPGHPLFDAGGKVLGFAVEQEGVGEQQRRPFLMPLDAVQKAIEDASKEAEKVLAEGEKGEDEAGAPSDG